MKVVMLDFAVEKRPLSFPFLRPDILALSVKFTIKMYSDYTQKD